MSPYKLIVVLIFSMVLRGAIIAIFGTPDATSNYYLDKFAAVIMYIVLFGICAYEFGQSRKRLLQTIGKPSIKHATMAALFGVVFLFFTFGESSIIFFSLSQFDVQLAYRLGKFHEYPFLSHDFFSPHVLTFIVSGVLFPAIFEEYFFRGWLLEALLTKKSNFWAAFICSVVFTICHFAKMVYFSTFLFSFVLCIIMIRTRSLYICMIIHGTYNFLAFLTQYYFDFHRLRSINQLSALSDWIPEITMLLISLIGLSQFRKIFEDQGKAHSVNIAT